jgi:hypothetical protein
MKLLCTLLLAAVCFAGFLARPAATAPDDHQVVTVRGVITRIDTDHRGFLFRTRRGPIAVRANDDTRVAINGEAAALDDLREGMRAAVHGPVARERRIVLARGIRVRTPSDG